MIGRTWSRILGVLVVAASALLVQQVWHSEVDALHWKHALSLFVTVEGILLAATLLDVPGRAAVRAARAGQHRHALSPMYSTIWSLWVVGVLLFELLTQRPGDAFEMAVLSGGWTLVALSFLAFELTAAAIPRTGDTLSETVWAFLHHEPSRGSLAMGFAWLLLIRLVEIGQPAQITLGWLGDANLGRLLFALGIGGWLTTHWVHAERQRLRQDATGA